MKFTLFIVVFLFSFPIWGQEPRLIGEWIMTKVVLEEELYKQPGSREIKSFTSLETPRQHFLLNHCITKLNLTPQEQIVELENIELHAFKLKQENGFLIIDEETGNRFIYHYHFENTKELLLTTPDIFYNKAGKSMRVNLKIYLKQDKVS